MSTTTASTIANNARFNAEAVKWDSNVAHVRCCEMALESVLHHVPAFADGQAKSRIVQIMTSFMSITFLSISIHFHPLK